MKTIAALRSASIALALLSAAQDAPAEVPIQEIVIDASATGDCKALGDLDGDGALDVILGGSELAWYRFPAWTRFPIATAAVEFTTDMQVGDVDADGDLDLVVPDGFTLHWFENPRPAGPPHATPWARHTIGVTSDFVHDVEVGDLDRDGRLDVVSRKGATDLWFQNAVGPWTRVGLTGAVPAGEGTALGDVDRDGDLDAVFNGYWMRAPSNPRVAAGWTLHVIDAAVPSQVGAHVADLDGDTRLDVAISPSEGSGSLAWYQAPLDPVSGTWVLRVIDAAVDHVHTFKSADFDADGDLDLATAEMHIGPDPDRVTLYLNGGGGSAGPRRSCRWPGRTMFASATSAEMAIRTWWAPTSSVRPRPASGSGATTSWSRSR